MTAARIGLKRSGAALATAPLLDFRLAHARARDAVHEPLDDARLMAELAASVVPVISIASAAEDRQTYLMRPDLGRRLAPSAADALAAHRGDYDVVFVIADGLSARAVHAARVAGAGSQRSWPHCAPKAGKSRPLVVVRHGRVAIGDAIAMALGAPERRGADRRTAGAFRARQHGRLSNLATACPYQRCRP